MGEGCISKLNQAAIWNTRNPPNSEFGWRNDHSKWIVIGGWNFFRCIPIPTVKSHWTILLEWITCVYFWGCSGSFSYHFFPPNKDSPRIHISPTVATNVGCFWFPGASWRRAGYQALLRPRAFELYAPRGTLKVTGDRANCRGNKNPPVN